MDTLARYRQIVQEVLGDYAHIPYAYGDVQSIVVADTNGDHYLWMDIGWRETRRIYNLLVQIDIIDGKVWIQYDGTDQGVALDLEAAGIPKDHIVLAFHSPEDRQYTEYAVA